MFPSIGQWNKTALAQPRALPLSVFGIQLTPVVGGFTCGVAGFLAAAYGFTNLIQPLLDQTVQLEREIQSAQESLLQQSTGLQKFDEAKGRLAAAERRKASAFKLFTDTKSLSTLLMDVNQIVENAGAATVTSYVPGSREPYGKGLFHQDFTITIEGNFAETIAVFRNLERMQPILLVEGVKLEMQPDQSGKPRTTFPRLNTSFILKVISPPTMGEVRQLQPSPSLSPDQRLSPTPSPMIEGES